MVVFECELPAHDADAVTGADYAMPADTRHPFPYGIVAHGGAASS